MRIFISYSHQQVEWVRDRLVPCLKAGGAEVLIDEKQFEIGKSVVGQMDAVQDRANKHLLVLTPEYLASKYCKHEMMRALKLDAKFDKGLVLPVLRVPCALPKAFTGWNPPLYAKLESDKQPEPWNALLQACGADGLGASAPDWLEARDDIVRFLERKESVNLLTNGRVNWEGLLDHIKKCFHPDLVEVDLHDPDTVTRRDLLSSICKALGETLPLREEPHDLTDFKRVLQNRTNTRVALTHFDMVLHKPPGFDVNFFAALRYMSMDMRKLTLLIQSRTAVDSLLPSEHPLSSMNFKTVELRGYA